MEVKEFGVITEDEKGRLVVSGFHFTGEPASIKESLMALQKHLNKRFESLFAEMDEREKSLPLPNRRR